MTPVEYPGTELELFAHARNWKRYWGAFLRPFIRGDVLEVGAGLGVNTEFLAAGAAAARWVCVEPDPRLAAALVARVGSRVHIVTDTIDAIRHDSFDCILYLDVLEHIEDDADELGRAVRLLRPGGRLVVLAPAHQRLYSAFDRAIGHFRRYSRETLRAAAPPGMRLLRLACLDTAGLLASFANLALLRQASPTLRQIRTWDRLLVPLSRVVDPLLGHAWGRSVVAVWTKNPSS